MKTTDPQQMLSEARAALSNDNNQQATAAALIGLLALQLGKPDPNPVVAEETNMYARKDGTIYFKGTHQRIDLTPGAVDRINDGG